jgi:lysophospholipid acyltransferase 7
MNSDDKIYISLLIISIPFGFIFKYFNFSSKYKAYLSSLIGFIIVFIVCNNDIYHSLVLSIINAIIIKSIHPKYVHYFSSIWSFGYLLFFRITYKFGLPQPVAYANAVQLILTLKTVGLAFETHDSYIRLKKLYGKENSNKNGTDLELLKLEIEFFSVDPKLSFVEIMCYFYCYIGILTGPYFKFRTYKDWLNFKNGKNIDSFAKIAKRGISLFFLYKCNIKLYKL